MKSTGPARLASRAPQSRALGQMPCVPFGMATSSSGNGSVRTSGRMPSGVSQKQVKVNGHFAAKASDTVKPGDEISVIEKEKYVSRGGLKLEKALKHFQLDVSGSRAVDLGASTGGFTDCLLQAGATQVYAVDVGRGQLNWKLREDSRVIVMEGVKARLVQPKDFPRPFLPVDLAVIDCSFISLKKILPTAVALTHESAKIVALIKPQFEAGKRAVDAGRGVITDPEIHSQVIDEIQAFVESEARLRWRDVVESPIKGPAGNTEFLALIERTESPDETHRADCKH